MIHLKKIVYGAAGLCCSLSTMASELIFPDELPIQWSSIVTLSGGVAFGTAGQNLYLYPTPYPDYQFYTYNSGTSTMGSSEIFFGLQRIIYPNVIGQLGLGIAYVSDAEVTGYTTVNGVANAYSYSYKVNHGRVELKGKLIGYTIQPVQPYISASLGVGFNNSHDYQPVQLNSLVPVPIWYPTNTAVALPYSFGVGVQTNINPNWQIGLGYQFADLGKSHLNGDGTFLNKGLGLTHMYVNEALASISYVFS